MTDGAYERRAQRVIDPMKGVSTPTGIITYR
jgi:hypothetical protein